MDGRRFDEFSKLLAVGATRRQLCKALASGVSAGVLGWRTGEELLAAEEFCCCR